MALPERPPLKSPHQLEKRIFIDSNGGKKLQKVMAKTDWREGPLQVILLEHAYNVPVDLQRKH